MIFPLSESKRLVLGLDEVREEPESFEIETMCKKISDDMAKMSTAYNNNGVQNNNNDMHKTSTAQNNNNDVAEMSTAAGDEQLPPVNRELKVQ